LIKITLSEYYPFRVSGAEFGSIEVSFIAIGFLQI